MYTPKNASNFFERHRYAKQKASSIAAAKHTQSLNGIEHCQKPQRTTESTGRNAAALAFPQFQPRLIGCTRYLEHTVRKSQIHTHTFPRRPLDANSLEHLLAVHNICYYKRANRVPTNLPTLKRVDLKSFVISVNVHAAGNFD